MRGGAALAAQVAAFVNMGGSFEGVRFTQPQPLLFSDHEGYVSLFDGASLKGWDGSSFDTGFASH